MIIINRKYNIFFYRSAFSHSSSLNPNNSISFSKSYTKGRLISIPFSCNNFTASFTVKVSNLSFSFSSLYRFPLVLNNFFKGILNVFNIFSKSSSDGVVSFTF